MKKKVSIRLNNPCIQNWEEMFATDNGRFCNNCKKYVTDFTGLSDSEIVTFFKTSKTEICGRFYKSQLNRPIAIPLQKKLKTKYSKYIVALIILPLINNYATGQTKINSTHDSSYVVINTKNITNPIQIRHNENQEYIISGKVLNSNRKENLSGVSVIIKNKIYRTTTDKNGYFNLKLPEKFSKKDFKIIFSLIGYNQLTVKVQNKKETFNKELNIFLHESNIDMDEVIVVGGAFRED